MSLSLNRVEKAQQMFRILHKNHRAALVQFGPVAITPERTDWYEGMEDRRPYVLTAVTHHPHLSGWTRTNETQRLFEDLSLGVESAIQCGSADHWKEALDTEISQHSSGKVNSLRGGDGEFDAVVPQCPQHFSDPVVEMTHVNAVAVVVRPIARHRDVNIVADEAKSGERHAEGWSDEITKCFRRGTVTKVGERQRKRVQHPRLRIGEGPVEIKDDERWVIGHCARSFTRT